MLGYFRRLTLTAPVTAVISLLLGVLFIAMPGASKLVICRLSCLCMAVCGMVCLLDFFRSERSAADLPGLVLGAAAAGFGLFGTLRPRTVNKLLLSILGILLMLLCVGALLRALSLYGLGYRLWWVHVICAAVPLLFSLSVILHPVFYGNLILRMLGLCFAVSAVSDLLVIRRLA